MQNYLLASSMIHGIYGLAHIGLSQFNSLCKKEGLNYAIASPSGLEKREIGEDVDPYPVVILSAVNFLKLHKKFKSRKVCVFVIDNPIQLEALDAGILGCTKIRTYHYRFFPVKSQDIRMALEGCGDKPIEVHMKKTRVIYDLMQAASAESILSPMQTAFYIIKNVEDRTKVQDAIFDWLAGRMKEEKVNKLLNANAGEAVRIKIKEIMAKPTFHQLRKACTAILAGELKFDQATKKFKVPLYDLRYVCKKSATKFNIELPG